MKHDAETNAAPTQWIHFCKTFRLELAILFCFAPLVCLHFRNLWRYDHYQYFPLILLAFPYLVWNSRGAAPDPPHRWWEFGFTISSLLLLGIALFFWSPNLAMLGAIFAAGGLLLAMRRTGWIRQFLPLWIPLWFLVRLPGNLDISLIFTLQSWTSRAASLLIDAMRIDHALLGNVIWAGTHNYFVEEACSGINSLFSLTALTAVALVLYRRPPLHAISLMLAAAFWACMVNILRVAALVLFNERFQIDLLEGTPHTVFGMILFAFAIAMLISTDQFLMTFHESEHVVDFGTTTKRDITTSANQQHPQQPPHAVRQTFEIKSHWFAASLCPLFALLLLCQLYSLAAGTGRTASRNLQQTEITFTADDLPTEIDGWKQEGFEVQTRNVVNYLGERSAIWTFRRKSHEVLVAVDYPFWHWHELILCYQAQGKELAAREVLPSSDELPPVVLAELTAVSGQASRLAFCLFRQSGTAMQPPPGAGGALAYFFTRFDNNLDTFFNRHEPTYQVQVLAPIPDPTNRLSDEAILALHREVTQTIRALVPQKAAGG
ncbi:Transmembrane exosortase (Exosortase_EpsH) [Rosistilla carotiformis]|uniref:Transmembrane exosortase (Exosortase_EpsH) n=1 Tax=Rosistilla carotiformis TaxID=2528017 RepID=A0A518JPC6_9BACT|nr:exosortase U [Rosistilla carotiformis]QDV67396.1 Transmembrane exosortase (Exosortase_EpsH) [Rosistilla carotiformis]